MNAYALATIMGIAALPILALMWVGWRARGRRDAAIPVRTGPLAGDTLAEFARVSYVSTTPVGEPFTRVSVPGLVYKGYARLAVRRDGVEIEVTGEPIVAIGLDALRGSGSARGRVGKIVERDGLALLLWDAGDRSLESSFRFSDPAEQQAFAAAIDELTRPSAAAAASGERGSGTPDTTHTTQEDA